MEQPEYTEKELFRVLFLAMTYGFNILDDDDMRMYHNVMDGHFHIKREEKQ